MIYLFVQPLLDAAAWMTYTVAVIATIGFCLSVVITVGDMARFCLKESRTVHALMPEPQGAIKPHARQAAEGAVDWWQRLSSVINTKA